MNVLFFDAGQFGLKNKFLVSLANVNAGSVEPTRLGTGRGRPPSAEKARAQKGVEHSLHFGPHLGEWVPIARHSAARLLSLDIQCHGDLLQDAAAPRGNAHTNL